MNILFVCHRLPYPPNRGGKIRSFNMIRHFAEKHSVVVASLAHSQEELKQGEGLKDFCDEVIAEVLPDSIRWLRAVKALFTTTPSSVAYFASPRLQSRIRQKMQETNFDIVFVHCAFVAQYVLDSKASVRILDYGDIDSAKWREYSHWKSLPFSAGYAIEARKLRNYEREVASRFHHCTVTTSGEEEEFQSLGVSMPCTVIPNGVDTTYFSKDVRRMSTHPVIVFVGRMDYYPNIDAVCFFAESIFPRIRPKVPNVEFRIIGSDPSRQVRELAKIPGITVTGHVSDVRTHLKDALLSVAPLRIARGTQNKILESMAIGLPVVATPQAAKGIQAVPGRDFLVAGKPDLFAQEVVNLLKDASLRERFARAARKQIEIAHLWPTSMGTLDGLLPDDSASILKRQIPISTPF
jgi:sugar transferase (PEP-CTERM/EpsH1 system associated)